MAFKNAVQFTKRYNFGRNIKFQQNFLPVVHKYRRAYDQFLPFSEKLSKQRTDICLSETDNVRNKDAVIRIKDLFCLDDRVGLILKLHVSIRQM